MKIYFWIIWIDHLKELIYGCDDPLSHSHVLFIAILTSRPRAKKPCMSRRYRFPHSFHHHDASCHSIRITPSHPYQPYCLQAQRYVLYFIFKWNWMPSQLVYRQQIILAKRRNHIQLIYLLPCRSLFHTLTAMPLTYPPFTCRLQRYCIMCYCSMIYPC